MNLREIAARARVSTATVSRALNQVPTVDPRLARRVWQVVDEFHYYPNTQARALVSGTSRTFGLIISAITDPFFAEVVQSFEEVAVQNRYEVLLSFTGSDPGQVEKTVRRMIERRVDGVAILTSEMQEVLVKSFLAANIPMVLSATQCPPGTFKIAVGLPARYPAGCSSSCRTAPSANRFHCRARAQLYRARTEDCV